ncbi:MAG: DNA-3-methyladenine glycosylase [Microbacteriaceae bacterium]
MELLRGYRGATRAFFERDVLEVAPELLGALLLRTDAEGTVGIRITEVEAYAGERDPGAHSYRGKTKRNQSMFGAAGHIYCYFTYGLHHAINLVCSDIDQPYGCLIRAGEIVIGADLARSRRERLPRKHPIPEAGLARGPGNVTQSFAVTLKNDGDDLFSSSVETGLEDYASWQFLLPETPPQNEILKGPRIGVNGEGGNPERFPWRFWLDNEPSVSASRTAKPLFG